MRLNLRALAMALGLIWGGAVFLVGLANLLLPTYGSDFLSLIASIYPGYRVGGFINVIIGTAYALLDGAACGVIVGWLYNIAAPSSRVPGAP
ncbi:MAG TPA: hypothetical protein VLV45_05210 [Gemmatimonadales bacterium]|nr:hypothetical protein [Gemmatimonadales bacterium]